MQSTSKCLNVCEHVEVIERKKDGLLFSPCLVNRQCLWKKNPDIKKNCIILVQTSNFKMATYPNNNHKLHIFCFNKNKKKQDSVFNFKLMFLLSIYNSHFKRREIYWLILLILLRKMLLEIVSRYNTFWLAVLHVVLFQLQE